MSTFFRGLTFTGVASKLGSLGLPGLESRGSAEAVSGQLCLCLKPLKPGAPTLSSKLCRLSLATRSMKGRFLLCLEYSELCPGSLVVSLCLRFSSFKRDTIARCHPAYRRGCREPGDIQKTHVSLPPKAHYLETCSERPHGSKLITWLGCGELQVRFQVHLRHQALTLILYPHKSPEPMRNRKSRLGEDLLCDVRRAGTGSQALVADLPACTLLNLYELQSVYIYCNILWYIAVHF